MVFEVVTNLTTSLYKMTILTLLLNIIRDLKLAHFQGALKIALQEAVHGGLQKFAFAEVPPVF
jgi:hypothetical protein